MTRLPRMLAVSARLGLALTIALTCLLPAAALEYRFSPPTPTGTVRVLRPTVSWRILPGQGDWISGAQIRINGYSVRAAYRRDKEAVVYTPSAALKPGEYSVHCQVELNGQRTVERKWRFVVAEDATDIDSQPEPVQNALVSLANQYRRVAGLSPFRYEPLLAKAADAHARYLYRNREYGHTETPGRDDYSGERPSDRVAAFGYTGGSYEGVYSGVATPESAVTALFDAPYHRLPFLQPGRPDIGAGYAGDGDRMRFAGSGSARPVTCTLTFGDSRQSGTVLYPADGQRDVPLSWDGNETPNPLRIHHGVGPTGYVVTLFHFSEENGPIRVGAASLTTSDGRPVAIYVNTPENDPHLSNGVFLIPKSPLLPYTTYRVSVIATSGSGSSISRRWSFTTGAGAASPFPPGSLAASGGR